MSLVQGHLRYLLLRPSIFLCTYRYMLNATVLMTVSYRSKGWRSTRSALMLASIATMWAFTMAYWIVTVVVTFRLLNSLTSWTTFETLSSRSVSSETSLYTRMHNSRALPFKSTLGSRSAMSIRDSDLPRLCAATSALTVNVRISLRATLTHICQFLIPVPVPLGRSGRCNCLVARTHALEKCANGAGNMHRNDLDNSK